MDPKCQSKECKVSLVPAERSLTVRENMSGTSPLLRALSDHCVNEHRRGQWDQHPKQRRCPRGSHSSLPWEEQILQLPATKRVGLRAAFFGETGRAGGIQTYSIVLQDPVHHHTCSHCLQCFPMSINLPRNRVCPYS